MRLRIEEIFWGISRRDGEYSERVTADLSFPCAVGEIPPFGKGGRCFFIDKVNAKSIVLSVRYDFNPSANESWNIRVGTRKAYTPRSFDGGYKYRFYLSE